SDERHIGGPEGGREDSDGLTRPARMERKRPGEHDAPGERRRDTDPGRELARRRDERQQPERRPERERRVEEHEIARRGLPRDEEEAVHDDGPHHEEPEAGPAPRATPAPPRPDRGHRQPGERRHRQGAKVVRRWRVPAHLLYHFVGIAADEYPTPLRELVEM